MLLSKTVVIVLLCVVSLAASGFAEEKPSATASVGIFNKYIFRGYELSKKSIVVQPAASVSYYGFSMGFWGNIDTRQQSTQSFLPNDKAKKFNETDLTLSYAKSLGPVSLTAGWTYYGTDYTNETEELFLTIGLDVIAKPTLSIYRDINEYKSTYINFGVSHSFNLTKEITFDIAATAGYLAGEHNIFKTYDSATGNYNGKKYKALHDGMLKVGMTIPAGKFTIQPSVQYWLALSSDAKKKDLATGSSFNPMGHLDNNIVYGVTVGLSF